MIIELPAKPQIIVGNSSRNSGGTQVITGVGFKPVGIITLYNNSAGTLEHGEGICDGVNQATKYIYGGGNTGASFSDRFIRIYVDSNNHIKGLCTSIDNDGFTIVWTLVGTITVSFVYMCIG